MGNFKKDISNSFNNAGYGISKNWPQVGTGLGIFGLVASGIWGIAVTKRALKKIEADSEEKYGDPDSYTAIDAIKSGWPYYVGPACLAFVSGGSIVSGLNTSIKRSAANYALYAFTEQQLREHIEKTEQIVGHKKAEEIKQAVADEDAKRAPQNTPIHTTTYIGNGKFPWYDPLSKSKVYSNKTTMDDAVNRLNHKMINGMEPYISYDQFCDEVGFERMGGGIGETIGWDSSRLIEIDDYMSESIEDPNTGEPMRVLKFACGHGPEPKYDSLH